MSESRRTILLTERMRRVAASDRGAHLTRKELEDDAQEWLAALERAESKGAPTQLESSAAAPR